MKYIKRKSAVKPITGQIVDTVNVDDTTTNTYSARIINEKETTINNNITTTKNNILRVLGIGSTQLTRASGADINSLDLNGFVYLSGCNQGGTLISNGYLLQLTYTNLYKIQFIIFATGNANFRYRRMVNGAWEEWTAV